MNPMKSSSLTSFVKRFTMRLIQRLVMPAVVMMTVFTRKVPYFIYNSYIVKPILSSYSKIDKTKILIDKW